MAEREQVKRTNQERPDEGAEEATLGGSSETGDRLKAEMDDLLDEIDDVLETNAEDFVKSYVQKGGE